MIVPQVRRRAARGRRPGRPLFLGVIVLALGPLDNLVRLLVEVEACATRKEGQRDRRSDRLYSPSACDRSHPSPPPARDSRAESMLGVQVAARQGSVAASAPNK